MIIVFTKVPVPGKTKTRLIPLLGEDGAADMHREMSEYILMIVGEFCRQTSAVTEIRFCGGSRNDMESWLGSGWNLTDQGEGDLGDRLRRATEDAFRHGAREVVVIGTDCPELSIRSLRDAFRRLETNDVVIGPAADGGYYLIGLSMPAVGLFEGIDWGSRHVMEQTLEKARKLDLEVAMLETLHDIDRPKDYPIWKEIKQKKSRLRNFY